MRMADGSYRLIDLDSSARVGDELGEKTSSAFAPPEMFVHVDGRTAIRSCHVQNGELVPDEAFTLLRATTSYDMFSFACVLFRALTRRQLINVSSVAKHEPGARLVHILSSVPAGQRAR